MLWLVAWIDPLHHHLGGDRLLARPGCRPQGAQLLPLLPLQPRLLPGGLIVAYLVSDKTAPAPA